MLLPSVKNFILLISTGTESSPRNLFHLIKHQLRIVMTGISNRRLRCLLLLQRHLSGFGVVFYSFLGIYFGLLFSFIQEIEHLFPCVKTSFGCTHQVKFQSTNPIATIIRGKLSRGRFTWWTERIFSLIKDGITRIQPIEFFRGMLSRLSMIETSHLTDLWRIGSISIILAVLIYYTTRV